MNQSMDLVLVGFGKPLEHISVDDSVFLKVSVSA